MYKNFFFVCGFMVMEGIGVMSYVFEKCMEFVFFDFLQKRSIEILFSLGVDLGYRKGQDCDRVILGEVVLLICLYQIGDVLGFEIINFW